MNLENTKIYTTDPEVIRKYAELCGVELRQDHHKYERAIGYYYNNFKCHNRGCVESFLLGSAIDSGYKRITLDQINALYDEKFGNNSEAPNSSEWKNGDLCIWNGIECVFIGMSNSHPSIAAVEYLKGFISVIDKVYVEELRKPETPEQREERERVIKLRTMAEDAMKDIDAEDGDHSTVDGVVFRMIAAGYRKQKDGE